MNYCVRIDQILTHVAIKYGLEIVSIISFLWFIYVLQPKLIIIFYFLRNLVFINEVGNDAAARSVDVAMAYIRKNPNLGLSVELISVEGNRTDSKGLLESSKFNYSLLSGV